MLATALLATGPILADTVVQFAFRQGLSDAEPLDANLRLFRSAKPDQQLHQELTAEVGRFGRGLLGSHMDQIIPSGGTRYAHPWVGGQLLRDQRVNLRFYGATDDALLDKASIVAGTWPTARPTGGRVAAVVVPEPMASSYGLDVGDSLPLSLGQNDTEPEFWLEVAGIIAAADDGDRFWFGDRSPLRASSDARHVANFSVLLPAELLFELAESWFSPSDVSFEWYLLLSTSHISINESQGLQARLNKIDRVGWTLGEHRIRIESNLLETLGGFDDQAQAIRGPLLALTSAIMLMALYYVVMAAALSLQQVEGEFATLRGRGASSRQLFRLQMLEGALIGLVALASGPGLAWSLVSALTLWGPLAGTSQTDWVIRVTSSAWLAALTGSVVCVGSLLLPLPGMLRRTIVAHQQRLSRANRRPWWQRYYLDLFILLGGLLLVWRLRTAGSIVGGDWQQPRVDWLLLLAPLALMLGAATVMLRLFPYLLNLSARLASLGRGLPAALAMWQAAREPAHFARLVLLLTMAMALGLFSSGIDAALAVNELDRARYASGSDIRLAIPGLSTAVSVASATGIEETAVAWRNGGSLTTRIGSTNPRFDLLAIDPGSFDMVAEFRPDFADSPMPELLQKLQASLQSAAFPLHGNLARVGAWVLIAPDLLDGYSFKVKLKTAQDAYFSVPLRWSARVNRSDPPDSLPERSFLDSAGPEMEAEWYFLDGPLPEMTPRHLPLSVHSIWILWRKNQFWSGSPIGLDDLSIIDEAGKMMVAEPFESELNWFGVTETFTTSLDFARPHGGLSHLMLHVTGFGLRPNRWYGVNQAAPMARPAIPALVSRRFAETARLNTGDPVATWVDSAPTSFEVVGIVDYFPSLYEQQDAGFLITNRKIVLAHLNGLRDAATTSNEIFVDGVPALSESSLVDEMPELFARQTRFWEAEAIRQRIKSDPMALGLRGATLFAYLMTLSLSLVAFAAYFSTNARRRRPMFGVLRALGLSRRQLYLALFWEQLVLVLSGLTLGLMLGLLLNRLTLPGLPLSLGGQPPAPPFLAPTNWTAVGQIYLTLAVAFVLLLGIAVARLWRAKLHRTLRVGEE
jgi:hypothetical protein